VREDKLVRNLSDAYASKHMFCDDKQPLKFSVVTLRIS